jgi:hypothetical protein
MRVMEVMKVMKVMKVQTGFARVDTILPLDHRHCVAF